MEKNDKVAFSAVEFHPLSLIANKITSWGFKMCALVESKEELYPTLNS